MPSQLYAQAKQKPKLPVNLVQAEKIYQEWDRLVDQYDNEKSATDYILKKYKLKSEQLEMIKQTVEDDDFKSKQIYQEVSRRIKESEKKLKRKLTPKEIARIEGQVQKVLDPKKEHWDDYEEYRDERKEKEFNGECEYVNVICHASVLFVKNLIKLMNEIVGLVIEVVTIDDKDFYGTTKTWHELPNNNVIVRFQKSVQGLAWTFLGLFFTYQCIRVLAIYSVEVNPTEVKNLLLRLVSTGILIYFEPYLVKLLLTLNGYFIQDVLSIEKQIVKNNLIAALGLSGGVAILGSPLIVSMASSAIGLLLIILFQVVIRYSEIVILAVIGPFVIATNVNEHYNLFPAWWKSLLSVIFTTSVQIFLIQILFDFVVNPTTIEITGLGAFATPLLIIGFLIVVFKTPGFLKEWMYSTAGTASMGARIGVAGARMVATSMTKLATRIAFRFMR